jgi:hypothetical protein
MELGVRKGIEEITKTFNKVVVDRRTEALASLHSLNSLLKNSFGPSF